MTDRWIAPERLFDGHNILTRHAIKVVDGQVTDIAPAPPDAVPLAGLLMPGCVDLQVNGGGGVLLNTTPTAAGIATILTAHRALGTAALMPTVITDAPDVLERAADAALAARTTPGMIGLHIEGPHIATTRRGTHAAQFIRPLDDRTIATVMRLRKADLPVMITLAPEAATPDQIARLAATGAIVSLGHTDADAAQMQTAIAAGATCATHLYNAMSQMTGRAPGAVGAVINSDCFAGIICDGHHVADEMIALAIRARPADRTFLVSDAMATVGGPDHFMLYGRTITLRDGRLVNADGNLAGAHVTQLAGLGRLVDHLGTDPEQALRMVTSIPATCIGLPGLGQLRNRPVTDLIVLDDDLGLRGPLQVTAG